MQLILHICKTANNVFLFFFLFLLWLLSRTFGCAWSPEDSPPSNFGLLNRDVPIYRDAVMTGQNLSASKPSTPNPPPPQPCN